jgi:hypothetical protein
MITDRKKPGVAFWASAVVVVLVLYVASLGPVCWLTSRAGFRSKSIAAIYRPLTPFMATDDSFERHQKKLGVLGTPTRLRSIALYSDGLVSKYASLYAAEHWKWRFIADVEYSPEPVARMDRGYWEWCDSTRK